MFRFEAPLIEEITDLAVKMSLLDTASIFPSAAAVLSDIRHISTLVASSAQRLLITLALSTGESLQIHNKCLEKMKSLLCTTSDDFRIKV